MRDQKFCCFLTAIEYSHADRAADPFECRKCHKVAADFLYIYANRTYCLGSVYTKQGLVFPSNFTNISNWHYRAIIIKCMAQRNQSCANATTFIIMVSVVSLLFEKSL